MDFKWGIIGTGGIAKAFSNDLNYLPGHTVHAVGSRTKESAISFCSEYPECIPYSSYDDLVNDLDIDAVYVATPHAFHFRDTLLALNANKPVLCEKAFSINESEAKMMVALAKKKNLMLMEAMWMRFLPHIKIVKELLDENLIGEVQLLHANHGQNLLMHDNPRIFEPELGGGALLDLGVYPISLANLVLGEPQKIVATGILTSNSVDSQTNAIFEYPNGATAVISACFNSQTPCDAYISGTKGRIEIDRTFYCPTSVRLILNDGTIKEYISNYIGHGLREEASEFARCVRDGLIESQLMSHEDSIRIMATMDIIRSQIGLEYPNDKIDNS